MIFRKKPKILKMLPEQDIMVTLKKFGITKEDTELNMVALTVVDREKVSILSDGTIQFLKKPTKLYFYENNKDTYNILEEIYSDKIVVQASIKDIDKSLLLDTENYNSVKNTYEIARQSGHNIANDKELIEYATDKKFPPIRYVKIQQRLGKEAFKGSKVKQYKINCIICYDTDLVLSIKKVK